MSSRERFSPHVRVKEDQNSHTGYAMPEFPGYTGPASDQCWLIKVKAVTHRRDPIMQTCICPSEEHVSMAGIPTEASIYHKPQTIEEMVYHLAAKLVEPFGIAAKEYRRWNGM